MPAITQVYGIYLNEIRKEEGGRRGAILGHKTA